MRYIFTLWICFALLMFHRGACREESEDVRAAEAEDDEDYLRNGLSHVMNFLHGVFNTKDENVHVDINKRLAKLLKRGLTREQEKTGNPYDHLEDLMTDLQRVLDGTTENLHVDLSKRSDSPYKRYTEKMVKKAGEEEDPFISSLSDMMADLHRVYSGKIENLNANFNKRFTEQEKRYTDLEKKYNSLAEGLASKSRSRRQVAERVAFYVQLTHDVDHIGNFQPIIYDLVTTNIGKGYNKADGIFTAPNSGIYVFSWTSANNVHSHMQTELVVNNVVQGRTWSDAYDHQDVAVASDTAVLSLTSGDTVWIRSGSVHSAVIMGAQMSTFSGWLLN